MSNDSSQHVLSGSHTENSMIRNTSAMMDVVRNYYHWNLSVFPIEWGKRILDIGCGPCMYLDAILTRQPELYLATDFSQSFLDMARKRMSGLPNCRAERLDILNTSGAISILAGQKFDYVLCFDVLEHLHDDITALMSVRLKTLVNTAVLVVSCLQFAMDVEQRPVKWAFSRKA